MGALWKLRGPSFPAVPITGPMMKRNIFRQHIIDRRPGSGLGGLATLCSKWVTTRRMWLLTTGVHIKSDERLQHCSSAPLQNQTICRRNKIIGNCGWKCFGNFIDLRIQIPNRGGAFSVITNLRMDFVSSSTAAPSICSRYYLGQPLHSHHNVKINCLNVFNSSALLLLQGVVNLFITPRQKIIKKFYSSNILSAKAAPMLWRWSCGDRKGKSLQYLS